MSEELKEKIKCPICGIERASLARHVKSAHGLTKKQFLKEYPNHYLISPALREKARQTCKKQWDDNYYKKLAGVHNPKNDRQRREKKIRKATTVEERFKKGRIF